jgi:hypothetical protein
MVTDINYKITRTIKTIQRTSLYKIVLLDLNVLTTVMEDFVMTLVPPSRPTSPVSRISQIVPDPTNAERYKAILPDKEREYWTNASVFVFIEDSHTLESILPDKWTFFNSVLTTTFADLNAFGAYLQDNGINKANPQEWLEGNTINIGLHMVMLGYFDLCDSFRKETGYALRLIREREFHFDFDAMLLGESSTNPKEAEKASEPLPWDGDAFWLIPDLTNDEAKLIELNVQGLKTTIQYHNLLNLH